jgi:uncharacterized protein YdhG (YjbR/CyaY superfamily)
MDVHPFAGDVRELGLGGGGLVGQAAANAGPAQEMSNVADQLPGVETYLAQLGKDRRTALQRLRALVLEVAPEVAESMRYRMPTYDLRGELLCAFASQKRYMSLYLDPAVVDAHRAALRGLDLGKSCVRFRRLSQLPLDVVHTMLEETIARQERDAGQT